MSEAVASLSPAGAARIQDLIWPSRLTCLGPNLIATDHTGRTRTENLTGTIAGIGGGHINPPVEVRLGVPSVNMICDAATGNSFRFYPSMSFFLNTAPETWIIPNQSAISATRIVWSFCGSGIAPNAGNDFGLEIVPIGGFGTGRILLDASPGIGFRLADANVLQLLIRGGNGLITVPLTAAPFDLTKWHVLDIRIVSANIADATLTIRLDGVVQNIGALNSSWAVGSNLPRIAVNAATVGFMPCLVCNPGVINNFWTYQLRFQQAQNNIALL